MTPAEVHGLTNSHTCVPVCLSVCLSHTQHPTHSLSLLLPTTACVASVCCLARASTALACPSRYAGRGCVGVFSVCLYIDMVHTIWSMLACVEHQAFGGVRLCVWCVLWCGGRGEETTALACPSRWKAGKGGGVVGRVLVCVLGECWCACGCASSPQCVIVSFVLVCVFVVGGWGGGGVCEACVVFCAPCLVVAHCVCLSPSERSPLMKQTFYSPWRTELHKQAADLSTPEGTATVGCDCYFACVFVTLMSEVAQGARPV